MLRKCPAQWRDWRDLVGERRTAGGPLTGARGHDGALMHDGVLMSMPNYIVTITGATRMPAISSASTTSILLFLYEYSTVVL